MHEGIYKLLQDVAKRGHTTTYAEVAPLAGLDMARADHRNKIAELLDEISRHEHAQGRPLLSAVVVHAGGEDKGLPGKGFFKMAKSLKRHGAGDDLAFYFDELRRVRVTWHKQA